MGKIRDEMPPEALEHLDRLAAAEHQRFVEEGQPLAGAVSEPDDILGVYSIRLTNREKILLRQLATKTGRPATEIARDFIRHGLEESLSPQGKIRPRSDLGIKHLAFIAKSLRSFVDVFEIDELKGLAEDEPAKAPRPHSKKRA